MFLFLILFSSVSLAYSFNTAQAKQNDITITHGIASGDVTNHSAVIWSKSNTDSIMHTKYDTNPNFINPNISNRIQHVNNSIDYSGVVKLDNLKPNTQYYYQVWFSHPDNKSNNVSQLSIKGLFRTATDSTHQKISLVLLSMVIWADQNIVKDLILGYTIFSVIRDLSPDFFIFNGDQIYADCRLFSKRPR